MQTHERRSPGLLRMATQIRGKGALQFLMDQWRVQGDLFEVRMGRRKVLFVVDPEHVRQVLVTSRESYDKLGAWESSRQLLLGDGLIASTGALWKRQRRLMSSFFTPRSIEQYYPVIVACAEATARRWEALARARRPTDMVDEMTRLTATIILRSMFGMEISDVPRDPTSDQALGGVPVPVGTFVLLFPYATHRHPEFWDEPDRFDPDRFLPEREAARHPCAYFPFGAGQRICLGNSFAALEAHVLTALLARRFSAQLVAGHRPRIDTGGTLMVKNGLPMLITRRS